jgi:hypothetical protein
MEFPDSALNALGAWQRGWREEQTLRQSLATNLLDATRGLDAKYRVVDVPCYRKRFLHSGELVSVILKNELDEGVVSWTTKLEFAEKFKGIVRADAVTGAVFHHIPRPNEVVLNISALWSNPEFVCAVDDYKQRGGVNADALIHFFKYDQGEVILNAPLRGSEIVRLSGTPSAFDDLCEKAGIGMEQRDELWRQLFVNDKDPTMPRYTTTEGAQKSVKVAIKIMHDKIKAAMSRGSVKNQSEPS